jgi:hypothetical protein
MKCYIITETRFLIAVAERDSTTTSHEKGVQVNKLVELELLMKGNKLINYNWLINNINPCNVSYRNGIVGNIILHRIKILSYDLLLQCLQAIQLLCNNHA